MNVGNLIIMVIVLFRVSLRPTDLVRGWMHVVRLTGVVRMAVLRHKFGSVLTILVTTLLVVIIAAIETTLILFRARLP